MTIFDAIINNNLEKVKALVEAGDASKDDKEPKEFVDKFGTITRRVKTRTALEIAKRLNRSEIAEYLAAS